MARQGCQVVAGCCVLPLISVLHSASIQADPPSILPRHKHVWHSRQHDAGLVRAITAVISMLDV
jgi:hypothetical protein